MEQKSEFNDAIGHLNRMNFSLHVMGEYKRQKNSRGWFDELVIFYSELTNHISKNESDELETIRKKIAKSINSNRKIQLGTIDYELYEELLKFEIKLRKIYNKAGFEGKSLDDPRRAR